MSEHNYAQQAIDAEQGLFAHLLYDPAAFQTVAAMIRPEYLVEQAHRDIFKAMASCRTSGIAPSLPAVRQALGSERVAALITDDVSLASYLMRLQVQGYTGPSALDHARTVRSLHALRTISTACPPPGSAGLPAIKLNETFDRIDALRTEIAENSTRRASVGDIAGAVVTKAAAIARGESAEPGITTGLTDLDRAILGYRPGELIVAGGRPGMGKSTFATSSALQASDPHAARTGGVLFFGLELGADAVGARCLSDIAYQRSESPTHSAIRSGHLDHHQMQMIQEAGGRLNEHHLFIDHRSAVTVAEIEATCLAVQRRFEREGKRLDLVVVDYLKQVRASDRYKGNRVYEIGEITAGLRDIAKRLGLCVLLLVQLNRGVEGRDDKRPTLADLRESGDLENDADVVLLLYRAAYYLKRDLNSAEPDEAVAIAHRLEMAEHEMEIIVAKNRNGEGEQAIRAFVDIGRSAVRSATRRS